MKTKQELQVSIAERQDKLDDTINGLERGAVKDTLRVVIPMMNDQLALMRDIVEKLPE